ncbi:Carbamoyl-phosphate synthase large chain [hydrothermal vent metagenome]|uniref:carbamoyl-phosphate synthase (glutamine-hydrolyzing) n=1 Tax=hydrothermal vent metagenome TaxID=652676 RepID=A0A3B1E1T0_9ZZZZ
MGVSDSFGESFAKAQLSSGNTIALSGNVFLSLADIDKGSAVQIARELDELGFSIMATSGTFKLIEEAGIKVEKVLKLSEGRPNIVDLLTNKQIQLVINTTDSIDSKNDAFNIRNSVIQNNISYFTTVSAGLAVIEGVKKLKKLKNELNVKSIQEYLVG